MINFTQLYCFFMSKEEKQVIENFIKEWQRHCNNYDDCEECPINDYCCPIDNTTALARMEEITEKLIVS